MYAVEKSSEGEAPVIISQHDTLAAAITAARAGAAEAEAGKSIVVNGDGQTWWDNEGDWRNAAPGQESLDRMASEAQVESARTIILNESGFDTGITFNDYCLRAIVYGDNPADYGDNLDDFVFVSKDYALTDPMWDDVDEIWPDDLPVWQYRPGN